MMNNILDEKGEHNFRFLASVIALLCEENPIVLSLKDIEIFWSKDVSRLQYDIRGDLEEHGGTITFSLREIDE